MGKCQALFTKENRKSFPQKSVVFSMRFVYSEGHPKKETTMLDEDQERARLEAEEKAAEDDYNAERANERAIEESRDARFLCPRGGER
jgi:hypothetical protein